MPSPSNSTGEHALGELAQRHGFSLGAVASLFGAIVHGRGGMAQFDHPEFSGAGQWMQGGMTMVSDMFNHALKNRVAALCADLSGLLAAQPGLAASTADEQNVWWPAGLGVPSSSGSQNDMRYAWFGDANRLAVESNGSLTVYDTQDHRIGGIAQQQSGGQTLLFTSQHGTVDLTTLPVVDSRRRGTAAATGDSNSALDGPAPIGRHAESPAVPAQGSAATFTMTPSTGAIELIARLAELHAKGVLTDDEFSAKKAELLARL